MKRDRSAKPRARVVWDEENLDYLEAIKTPKQKILEPKTPYYAPDPVDGVSPTPDDQHVPMEAASHAAAVRLALLEVASGANDASTSYHHGCAWSPEKQDSGDFDCYDQGIENGSWSFKEHRRKHYDEYRKAKRMDGLPGVEDDDQSFENGTSSSNAGCSSSIASASSSGSGSSVVARNLDQESSLSKEMSNLESKEKSLLTSM